MHEEFGIAPFSPAGIFYLADGIGDGYVEMSAETSVVPFSCTMCGACGESCFTGGELSSVIYDVPTRMIEAVRGMFVEAGKVPEEVSDLFRSLITFKNAWRLPKTERVGWEKKCEISVPDYAQEHNEFLLFVGDASLIEETRHIPCVVARLLRQGGVDFGTFKEEEVDSGHEAREMGEEELSKELARENIEMFKQFSVKKVITLSPHDFDTFRHDYPKLGMEFEVYHYTEVISDLIKEGKIKLTKEIPKAVTYQDPCHLGRYNQIYDGPRSVIKAIPGVEFREMVRNFNKAFCCGVGGGRMWYDPKASPRQRISDIRVRDAKEVGADIIATACPYCLSNLKAAGNLDNVSIKDIAELVLESAGQ
jgi:Fe-S oxidoreductase